MLIYKTGDLLEAEEPIILHGCNARGVMGSGVAKAVRAKYPEAYDDYMAMHDGRGLKLGNVYWTWLDYPTGLRIVGNAITQANYGRGGNQYVDYDAIKTVFLWTKDFITHNDALPERPIAIPRIGAGLGGGDWDTIAEIIETTMDDIPVVVYSL